MKKQKILAFSLVIILTLQLLPAVTGAALLGNTDQATLSLLPSVNSVGIDEQFIVDIRLNTGGQNVVMVAAFIDFNADNFAAVSVETAGSVFDMNFEQVVDQANGRIKITRGVPTPGVNTADGFVARVNFRSLNAVAPAQDNLTLNFIPGSTLDSNVILDDGLGTDILSGVYNARVSVTAPVVALLSLTPAEKTLSAGESQEFIFKLQNAENIGNLIAEISYDENMLSFIDADFTGFNSACPDGFAFADNMAPGVISVVAECWDGLNGNADIAGLLFAALPLAGASDIIIESAELYDIAFDIKSYETAGSRVTVVISISADTTAPVISLNGSSYVTVEKGSVYQDAGATAYDDVDGDLSALITTDNPVNTAVAGTYTVRYNVSDAAGNAALEKTRTVHVIDTTAPVILSGGVAEVTQNFATIEWVTDEPANSQLEYGITSALNNQTALINDFVTSHSVTITGLLPGHRLLLPGEIG
jgi:hypothetical protein